MKYQSTRNSKVSVDATEAIIKGISDDGGLYVPSSFPKISVDDILKLCKLTYPERAASVISMYLDEFPYEELLDYCNKAYEKFDDAAVCPLVNIDSGLYILELWHGLTHAFKDMALSLMPYLMIASRKKQSVKNKTLILVATSGDTGKAALSGFADVDGTKIMVFYPDGGVSRMQRLQMITQQGDNVYVAAVKGNFDDTQSAVKKIFNDEKVKAEILRAGYEFSSANSINFGRLVPQIAYYISAYCELINREEIAAGDKINFVVPSGNFGNILAGYYAREMGLPIAKLICASNSNNVLTDFFISGQYDIRREFFKTMSPSMDILISSNLERLLYHISGKDDNFVKDLMGALNKDGVYSIDSLILRKNADCFAYGYSSEEETVKAISNFFETYGYLLDPHTAVAMDVYNNYVLNTEDETPTVIVSTASPYKFSSDVYNAVMKKYIEDPFKAARKLFTLSAQGIPMDLLELEKADIRFQDVLDKDKIAEAVIRNINA